MTTTTPATAAPVQADKTGWAKIEDVVSRNWRPFVYGGLASMAAEFATFPIDTTKTRLQIQGQATDLHNRQIKYRGMTHAMYRIASEEGAMALFRGLSPALLRQATYGTIKVGIYQILKRKLAPTQNQESLAKNIFCGVVAGVISSAIATPTDVLKVRLQARNESAAKYKGIVDAFRTIYHTEGVRGLWKGVGPTAQRAAIVTAVELPVYDQAKKLLTNYNVMTEGVALHFVSSFLAGFFGAVAANPIDVIKTRLMNQTRNQTGAYSGSIDCLVKTVRYEGVRALWKGFIPFYLRLGPWNIVFFMTYEQLKALY